MSEPVNRESDHDRRSPLGVLLFALAWGSLMLLLILPRDMLSGAPQLFDQAGEAASPVHLLGR